MDNNTVLISSALVFQSSKSTDKDKWFLVKNSEEEGWEFPRSVVRKNESSVRASIRMMGEQGAMTIRVIEEAGRAGGVTTHNGKTLPQRHLFYVARYLSDSGESLGFEESGWFDYSQASRKLESKREKLMLKNARKEMKTWLKERERKKARQKEIEAAAEEAE